MKYFVKLFIVFLIVGIGCLNYKIISLNGGLKVLNYNSEPKDVFESASILADTNNIYYYKIPYDSDDTYFIIFETNKYGMVFTYGKMDDINLVKVSSLLVKKFEPKSVSIIPWWIYLIAILVVLFFPTPKKQRTA